MLAVSNTSPISNLAIIGRLDRRHHRHGKLALNYLTGSYQVADGLT
jgi:predicted nucleic acid-binding protein